MGSFGSNAGGGGFQPMPGGYNPNRPNNQLDPALGNPALANIMAAPAGGMQGPAMPSLEPIPSGPSADMLGPVMPELAQAPLGATTIPTKEGMALPTGPTTMEAAGSAAGEIGKAISALGADKGPTMADRVIENYINRPPMQRRY